MDLKYETLAFRLFLIGLQLKPPQSVRYAISILMACGSFDRTSSP